jgi:hypothetical protein
MIHYGTIYNCGKHLYLYSTKELGVFVGRGEVEAGGAARPFDAPPLHHRVVDASPSQFSI